jgi:hypothetical protein
MTGGADLAAQPVDEHFDGGRAAVEVDVPPVLEQFPLGDRMSLALSVRRVRDRRCASRTGIHLPCSRRRLHIS